MKTKKILGIALAVCMTMGLTTVPAMAEDKKTFVFGDTTSCLFILLYLTCFFPKLTYFISALTAQKSPKLCFGSRVFQPLTVSHHLIRLFFGSR